MVDRRNPWLVVLWVLAVVLLAAGGWLLSQTSLSDTGTGDSVVPVFILPAVYSALVPWLIGTGLAALVGAVFVHAQRP